LANSFFCTLTPGNHKGYSFQAEVTLMLLYNDRGPTASSTRCIIEYFKQIQKSMPKGNIIIHRKALIKEAIPKFEYSEKKLCKITIDPDGKIEEAPPDVTFHVDFANKYIGGGALTGGNVQEEILFAIKPECIVSMLFCSKMNTNEAIIITGTQKFANYKGYALNWQFDGGYEDKSPFDEEKNCIKNHIIAIDALAHAGPFQYHKDAILRETVKAYCGFCQPEKEETPVPGKNFIIATGNWGCGAFGGNKQLKAVQQIVAASECGVDLLYYTFRRKDDIIVSLEFTDELKEFISYCQENDIRVGELYSGLLEFPVGSGGTVHLGPSQSVFGHLQNYIMEKRKKKVTTTTTETKTDTV